MAKIIKLTKRMKKTLSPSNAKGKQNPSTSTVKRKQKPSASKVKKRRQANKVVKQQEKIIKKVKQAYKPLSDRTIGDIEKKLKNLEDIALKIGLKEEYIVEGAKAICVSGPTKQHEFKASNKNVKVKGKNALTMKDLELEKGKDLFGDCLVLTAAASGSPQKCKCACTPFNMAEKSNVSIRGNKVARLMGGIPAIAVCPIGGVVMINSSGQ